MKKQKQFDPFVDLSADELEAALKLTAQALERASKNFHSMSLLYGAHNALTGQNIKAEACPSCLKERVEWLRKFIRDNEKPLKEFALQGITEKPADPPPAPKPAEPTGRILTLVAEGEPDVKVMFDETGKSKAGLPTGVVSAEPGKTLKPGTYAVDTGEILTVQPGGKASLKPFEDLT